MIFWFDPNVSWIFTVISSNFTHLPTDGCKTSGVLLKYKYPFKIKNIQPLPVLDDIAHHMYWPHLLAFYSQQSYLSQAVCPLQGHVCLPWLHKCRVRVRCTLFFTRWDPPWAQPPLPEDIKYEDEAHLSCSCLWKANGCPPHLWISKKSCLNFPFLPKDSASSCRRPSPSPNADQKDEGCYVHAWRTCEELRWYLFLPDTLPS